jgi:hypothetical protein
VEWYPQLDGVAFILNSFIDKFVFVFKLKCQNLVWIKTMIP